MKQDSSTAPSALQAEKHNEDVVTGRSGFSGRLFEILERQDELSGEFLNILNKEKDLLIAMDLNGLLRLSKRKVDYLEKMQALDRTLQGMAAEISGGGQDNIVNLGAFNPFVTPEETQKLAGYRSILIERRQEILARNTFNKRFAEDTVGYLNDALAVITGSLDQKSFYGATGMNARGMNGPRLISREV